MRVTWSNRVWSLVAAILALVMAGCGGGGSGGGGSQTLVTPPFFQSTPVTTAAVGTSYVYTIAAAGSPAPVLTASGLPGWLSLSGNVLSGVPQASDAGLTSPITINALNGVGPGASQTFQITVASASAPTFTSVPTTSAAAGVQYSYTISVSGSPAPLLSAPGLPSWLTLSGNTLSGTPSAVNAGPNPVVLQATNSQGTATQSFTISVTAQPSVAPSFTTTPPTSATVGVPFTYAIGVAGTPAPTISTTALPGWLTLAGNTLSGTPPAAGSVAVTLTATNGVPPAATQSFTLGISTAVTNTALVTISLAGAPGDQVSSPATQVAPNVASGSAISRGTGISPVGGTGSINSDGWTQGPVADLNDYYTVTVAPSPGFALSLAQLQVDQRRSNSGPASGELRSSRDGFAAAIATFTAGTATSTVSFPLNTAAFQGIAAPIEFRLYAYGTAAAGGTFRVERWALGGTLTALAAGSFAPSFTSTPPTVAALGITYTAAIGVTGNPAPTVTSTTLPPGLSLTGTAASGYTLGGSPSATGTFPVTLTATNGVNPAATLRFSIVVSPASAPVFASAPVTTVTALTPYDYFPFATGSPLPTVSLTSTTAPWLTFFNGALGGTPPFPGTFAVTLTASNVVGSATQRFNITVTANTAPPTSTAFVKFDFSASFPAPIRSNGDEPSWTAETVDPRLTPPVITRSGINPSPAAGAFGGTAYPTAASLDPAKYFTFTVTPTAGLLTMSLDSLEFTTERSNSGPQSAAVRTSIDGFASNVLAFTPGPSTITPFVTTVTLTAAQFQNIGFPVEFRVYGFNAPSTQGTLRLDQIYLTGTLRPLTGGVAPSFTSTAPTAATAGASYTYAITTAGNPAPTISTTTLPTGLAFSGSAATGYSISGTPAVAGSFPVTLTASNGVGTATQSFTIVVAPGATSAPAINGTPVTSATVGAAYAYTFGVTGTPTATVSLATSPSSTWLSVTSLGGGSWRLAGTPAASNVGVVAITLTATNGVNPDARQSFAITVQAAAATGSALVVFDFTGLPGNQTVTAAGIVDPRIQSPVSMVRGAGVTATAANNSMNSNSWNTVAFDPTAYYGVTVTPTAGSQLALSSLAFQHHISSTTTGPLQGAVRTSLDGFAADVGTFTPSVTANTLVTIPLTAAQFQTVVAPIEIRIYAFGNGTTNAAGTFRMEGTWALNGTATAISGGVAPGILGTPLTSVTVGASYSYAFSTTGSPAPSVSLATSPAAAWLSLAGTTLSGTPAAGDVGTYAVTLTATNSTPPAAMQSFTITVNAAPPTPVAPSFTSAPMTSAVATLAYSYTPVVTGTPAPSVTLTSTTAGWLSFAGGTLSGTPPTAGTFGVTLTASSTAGTATQSFSIVVSAAPVAPAITSTAPTAATVGASYTYSIAATGNPAPTVTSTALPSGLALTGSAGSGFTISGTPTTAGSFPVTLTASNGVNPAATQAFTIVIAPALVAPGISGTPVTQATAGSLYSSAFTVTGTPVPSVTFTASPAAAWLSLASAGTAYTLSGTPQSSDIGSVAVTLTASNGVGADALRAFTIQVVERSLVTITFTGQPGNQASTPASFVDPRIQSPVSMVRGSGVTATAAGNSMTSNSWNTVAFDPTAYYGVTITPTAGSQLALSSLVFQHRISSTTTGPLQGAVRTSLDGFAADVGTFTPSVTANTLVTIPLLAAQFQAVVGPIEIRIYGFGNGTTNAAGTFRMEGTWSLNGTATAIVNPVAPGITGSAPTDVTVGASYSYAFATTGNPSPVVSLDVAPAAQWLSLSGTTLSGTPAAGDVGTYDVTITASNGVPPAATQTFTITVHPAPPTPVAPSFTSTPVTSGVASLAYSYTPVVTGTPAPSVTLTSTTAGWLSFTGGTLSGTPPGAGPFDVTLTATNTAGSITQAFTIVVAAAPVAPSFTTTAPTAATVGATYTYGIGVSGNPAPTVTSTALPANLALSGSAGSGFTISGIPTTAGSFPVTLTASNGVNPAQTQAFTIVVAPALITPGISGTPVTQATAGTAYASAFTVTGTPVPSVTFTATPAAAWLSLAFAGGTYTLAGTPQRSDIGSVAVTLTASNGVGADALRAFTIQVVERSLVTITFTGQPGNQASTPAIFVDPLIQSPVSMVRGSGVTATAAGNSMTSNSWNTVAFDPTAYYGVTITPTAGSQLALSSLVFQHRISSTTTGPLQGAVRTSLDGFAADVGTFTPSVTANTLVTIPLLGAQFQAVVGPIEIRIYGFGNGTTNATGTFRMEGIWSLNGTATAIANPVAPGITGSAPTDVTVGASYSYAFATTGNPSPVVSVDVAPAAAWLSLSGTTLSGTPAAGDVGTYDVTITASNGVPPAATQTFTITVHPAPVAPSFTTAAPPTTATVGVAYSAPIAATGTPAPTLTLTTSPGWLSLAGGVLSGTPGAGNVGPNAVTITAANGVAPDATLSFSIDVAPPPAGPQFTSTAPTAATPTVLYRYVVTVTGTPQPTVSVTSGPLPGWLAFTPNAGGGVLQGTPQASDASQAFPIELTVSNINGSTPQSFTINVGAAPVPPQITSSPVLAATVGQAYTYTIVAAATPTATISAANLPAWLSLSGNTLTGTPAAGDVGTTGTITVLASNGFNPAGVQAFQVVVSGAAVSQPPVTLVSFAFTGTNGGYVAASVPDIVAVGIVTPTTMVRGPGLTTATSGAPQDAFGAIGYGSSFDATDYITFTITPTSGYVMSLGTLTFKDQRSGSGPSSGVLRSSLTGFAGNDVFTYSPANGSLTSRSVSFTNAFRNLTAPVEFRWFGFGATGGTGTFRLDDVVFSGTLTALPTPPPAPLLAERFETGLPPTWTATDDWQVGTPTTGPSAAFSGSGVAATNLNTSYTTSTQSTLTTPALNFTGVSRPTLRFRHWYDTEPIFDGGNLKISFDGVTFTTVTAGIVPAYDGVLDTSTPLDQQPAWGGRVAPRQGGEWEEVSVSLTAAFAGQANLTTVRLRFDFASDSSVNRAGWYIDDVYAGDVSGFPASPVPAIAGEPLVTATVGQPYAYTVVVTGTPAPTVSITGLPAWLTRSGNTIAGVPTAGDLGRTGKILITATSAGVTQTASQRLTVTVLPASGAPIPGRLLDEGFEGGTIPAGWARGLAFGVEAPVEGDWAVGAPVGKLVGAFAGTGVAATSLTADYTSEDPARLSVLETPSLDLQGVATPILRFHHFYATESGFDGGILKISTNGGLNFRELDFRVVGPLGYDDTALGGPLDGQAIFTGTAPSGYELVEVDLGPDLNGKPLRNVVIRFEFQADGSNEDDGWILDDVQAGDPLFLHP